jgi:hypothetical protein
MLGSIPARRAERFADSAPRADQPRRGLHATEQTPGRPAPTDGNRLPIPGDPPASTLVRRPDRWREQASAPEPLVGPRTQPWTAWWHLENLARALPDMRAVRLSARFRQGAAAGHPAWTPSPPISSSREHPAVG